MFSFLFSPSWMFCWACTVFFICSSRFFSFSLFVWISASISFFLDTWVRMEVVSPPTSLFLISMAASSSSNFSLLVVMAASSPSICSFLAFFCFSILSSCSLAAAFCFSASAVCVSAAFFWPGPWWNHRVAEGWLLPCQVRHKTRSGAWGRCVYTPLPGEIPLQNRESHNRL